MNAITNLTRLDLSDAENVKDCAFQFRRCDTNADFAAWAKRWGDPLLRLAEGPERIEGFVRAEELEDVEDELTEVTQERDALKRRIETTVQAIDKAMEGPANGLEKAMDEIVSKLEEAL
jgi:hypothetical protein